MSAPTVKQLASRHVRRLRTIREKVLGMSAEWEDLDEYCRRMLEDLAGRIEETAVDVQGDTPVGGSHGE